VRGPRTTSLPEVSEGLSTPSDPTLNEKTGLTEPTVADAIFLAITTPGYDGATGLNLLVWGSPGTGKTATAKDVLARTERHPYYVDLSLSAPEDLAGIPRVMFAQMSEDGKLIKIYGTTDAAPKRPGQEPVELAAISLRAMDATWLNVAADKQAVLIADDLTNAAQMVQAALLRVALERQISDGKGGFVSLKHMPVLAMANFGYGNALQPLLGPLANRFSHIVATDQDVLRWWNTNRASQLTLDLEKTQTLEQAFRELERRYWQIINQFVVEHQIEAFDEAPSEFTHVAQHAYASSRSYEFCVRWLAVCEHFGVQPDRFIHASLGLKKGGMLISWLRDRELGLQVMANTVRWEECTTDERNNASMWAARHFTTDTDLSGIILSVERLRNITEGSDDNNIPARDYLIHRALGLPVGPDGQVDAGEKGKPEGAMTARQVSKVRRAWPEQFKAKKAEHSGLLTPGDQGRAVA
jgi:AAA domain (dynein-related subfamily)